MRGIVLALLAASGCNWVFGLDHAVHGWDAGPPKMDAPPVATTSSYLKLAITTPDLCTAQSTCQTPPAIDFEPFGADTVRPDLPDVRVGPLVAQGADQPIPDLLPDPVVYSVADGSFAVPTSVTTGAWRAVITLPGDPVPHEVQWNLDDSHHGTLIVPSTTRFMAPAVPTGSGYDITPIGGPVSFSGPEIMTTGVFTFGSAKGAGTATATLDFSTTSPIYGPAGAPQVSKGDLVILADFAAQSSYESSVDGWAVTSLDLKPGAHSTPATQPMWHRPTPQASVGVDFNTSTNQTRLSKALGSLISGTGFQYRWTYGFSPNLGTFGFGEPAAPDYLEKPIILPIDILKPVPSPPSHMTFIDIDTSAVPLPRALYAAMTDTRTLPPGGACPSGIAGLQLTSGYAILMAASSNPLLIGDFPALMARNEQFHGLDLGNTDCGSTLAASTSSLDLTWSLEAPSGLATTVDDYEVVLYQVMPGSPPTLHPVRSYRVTAQLVQVDGALLQSGQYYVFGITSHWGFPKASADNYTTSRTPPFGSTTKFSAVFHIQ